MAICDEHGSVAARDMATPHISGLGAADWLSLAAAPTFAVMALLTGVFGGGVPDFLLRGYARCVAAHRHGADVFADERLSPGALAQADFPRSQFGAK